MTFCTKSIRLSRASNWRIRKGGDHLLSHESRGEKMQFEFMATPDYLPWSIRVSHPATENPAYTEGATDTVTDYELMKRNKRALDTVLAWIDLPEGMTKMEAARRIANEVVEFLTGMGLVTTNTTTTADTNTTTTSPTTSNLSASQPPKTKRMHGNTYQSRKGKKSKNSVL
ncbi:hypothetical protein Scep_004352 [Stephania cephalantha]|uniref:Uncharacterized protein n=1 Tax=Stephania cephalantha TaxID=152367 RepID=A0AAP0PVC4_9MAGN